jgi:hypothetical protein
MFTTLNWIIGLQMNTIERVALRNHLLRSDFVEICQNIQDRIDNEMRRNKEGAMSKLDDDVRGNTITLTGALDTTYKGFAEMFAKQVDIFLKVWANDRDDYVRQNEDMSDTQKLFESMKISTTANSCEAQFLSSMQLLACIPPDSRFGPAMWNQLQDHLELLLMTSMGRSEEQLSNEEKEEIKEFDISSFEGLNKLKQLANETFSGKNVVSQDDSVMKEQLEAARHKIEKLEKKNDEQREEIEKSKNTIDPETAKKLEERSKKLEETEKELKQAKDEIEKLKKNIRDGVVVGGDDGGRTKQRVRDQPKFLKYTRMLKLHMYV